MNMHAYWVGAIAGCLCLLGLAQPASAGQFYEKNGVAIDGYDPVAYFEEHRAVRGGQSFVSTYKGSTVWFVSRPHLEAFMQTPERFAPQFGGFCAYGMAEGTKAKSEGEVWAVFEGKLYLNYDTHIQEKWIRQRTTLIREAEANWPAVATKTEVYQ